MKEELYKKFVENILPEIQKGLVITKDYFLDLFGRYVKYLIVVGIFETVLFLTLGIIGCLIVKKYWKQWKETDEADRYGVDGRRMGGVFLIVLSSVSLVLSTFSFESLIKTIYIPEISVYENLKSVTNSTNK